MKKFQYQYSKTIKILLVAGLVLCALALATNIWRLVNFGSDNFYTTLQYILIFAVTLVTPVILISMMVSSKYEITDRELITRFGIIKSKFKLDDVQKLVYNTDKNKLFVYFKDGTYMNILVNASWQQEFIGCILEKKKKIEVEYVSGDEDE
ncbi:MAG: hypothetical protein J5993_00475 [Clostridia bacterium]|nr:hypothetical protein [Clostridia bacterium]